MGYEDEDELLLEEQPFEPSLEQAMPNVPRDPNAKAKELVDPREKVREYLMQKQQQSELMADPEYRKLERAPREEYQKGNSDLAFGQALMQSANQIGTIGGRQASSEPYNQFAKNMMLQNRDAMSGIMDQRKQIESDDDRRLKIMQYLANQRQREDDTSLKSNMLQEAQKQRAAKAEADERYRQQTLEMNRQRLDQGQQRLDSPQKPAKPEYELGQKEIAVDLAKKNASKVGIYNQIQGGIKAFREAKTDRDKIRIGGQMIKTLNSSEGADAVGAEEAKRLADALEYQIANFFGPGPAFGRDLKGFETQVENTLKGLEEAIKLNENMIQNVKKQGTSAVQGLRQDSIPVDSVDPNELDDASLDEVYKSLGGT